MRVLVTAGPTREMLDDVRFLSNLSSGKTGYAVAQAARDLGHTVTLVSGPVNLSPPQDLEFRSVISAADMHQACLKIFPDVDAVFMTAAVADYTPASLATGKMKKSPGDLMLPLTRTRDILADMGEAKGHQILIGFALEVQNAEENAMGKLKRKNADIIVLNGPANFGSHESSFRLVTAQGVGEVQRASKDALGRILVQEAEALCRK